MKIPSKTPSLAKAATIMGKALRLKGRPKMRMCGTCKGYYPAGPGGLSEHRLTEKHMDAAWIATLAPIAESIRGHAKDTRGAK